MNINDYIINEIKPLTLEDSVALARQLCEDFPISHIPIVQDTKFLGCFMESDLRTIDSSDEKLSAHSFLLQNFYVDDSVTVLDLISQFANNDCNLIPVLAKDNAYLGYYELADILDVFSESPFMQRDSDTLVVGKVNKDFSMSQVAQIVESNNAKLLGLYISSQSIDSVQVTLKVRTLVMNELIQTFRRYDYMVVTQHVDDEYLEQLKERSAYFKKFLEI